MNRERKHAHGVDRTTVEPEPERAAQVEEWPGKTAPTMTLDQPSASVRTVRDGAIATASAQQVTGRGDAPDVDAIDRHIADLMRGVPRRSDDGDQKLWVAQQQRLARWKQVSAWAIEHRTLRPRDAGR